jgi:hypothetical protein
MAKQHIPVDLNGFNVRNGIRVSYAVDGIDKQKAQWIHQIPTLKAAVAIAKEFSDEYQDGSSANITRRLDELAPPGSNYHHTGGLTHQWRIFKDGAIQLTTVHRSNKHDINKWLQSIPKPPSHTDNLKTQLYDLRIIADHIGYKDAAAILRRVRPESSDLQTSFMTSKIGHRMAFASNEGAMSSPPFEPQQSKESSMTTMKNTAIFIKPEYAENHKQLCQMEDDMHECRRRGSLKHCKTWDAIFMTSFGLIVIYFAFTYLQRQFGVNEAFGEIVGFTLLIVLTVRIFYLGFLEVETWDDVLLMKLTKYVPVNMDSYEILRSDVRDKSDLDWQNLRQFIADEKKSLVTVTANANVTNFLQRSI